MPCLLRWAQQHLDLTNLHGTPNLDPRNQFFFTLMKLRTYKTNFELSLNFEISEKEVYSTFVTWVRFMYLQWKEIDIWPTKECVNFLHHLTSKRSFLQLE